MTRLEEYLKNTPRIIFNNDDDKIRIKKSIPSVSTLSLDQIDELYSDFSTTTQWAGWLFVDDGTLKDFERWLNTSWGDGNFVDVYMETIDWKEPCAEK
jgi:N-glycosylase/DNA lyase